MGLIRRYERFTVNPAKTRSLIRNLVNYDPTTYYNDIQAMWEIYKRTPQAGRSCILRSNGSTTANVEYRFGPRPDVIPIIEMHLWSQSDYPSIVVLDKFPHTPAGGDFRDNGATITVNFRHPNSIRYLADRFKERARRGRFTARFKPNTLLFLGRSNFPDMINNVGELDRLVSFDFDPFYDDRAFGGTVNDQMVNWKSGVNFYTCKEGTKHFIPIWYRDGNRYYNLLNLSDKNGIEVDDSIELGNLQKCKCGRTYLDLRFIPHINNCPNMGYAPTLARSLVNAYFNMQFYQSDKLYLAYTAVDKDDDAQKIASEYSAQLLPNTTVLVGTRGKLPAFWRGQAVLTSPLSIF